MHSHAFAFFDEVSGMDEINIITFRWSRNNWQTRR